MKSSNKPSWALVTAGALALAGCAQSNTEYGDDAIPSAERTENLERYQSIFDRTTTGVCVVLEENITFEYTRPSDQVTVKSDSSTYYDHGRYGSAWVAQHKGEIPDGDMHERFTELLKKLEADCVEQ